MLRRTLTFLSLDLTAIQIYTIIRVLLFISPVFQCLYREYVYVRLYIRDRNIDINQALEENCGGFFHCDS